ncbi:MAG: hypothetical protein KY443_01100 [Actinobacteria bacterium]|nr:hypothetical protein [Actinomycetota bacterium]
MKSFVNRVLVVAAWASVLGLAVPVQPALAAPAQCSATGAAPYIYDEKLHLIEGWAGARCDRIVAVIAVWAHLEKWSQSAGQWAEFASHSDSATNVSWWFAAVIVPCPTNGYFRTTGQTRAVSDIHGGAAFGIDDDSYQSGSNFLRCYSELPDETG